MAGAELDVTDMYGRNCLHMSAFNGSIECLDFLISSGADCTSVDSLGKSVDIQIIFNCFTNILILRKIATALRGCQVSLRQSVQFDHVRGGC